MYSDGWYARVRAAVFARVNVMNRHVKALGNPEETMVII